MYSTLLAVVFLQFTAAWGQATFPYIIEKSGSIGMSVYGEADFDQDGFNDLATTGINNYAYIFSGKDFSLLKALPLSQHDGENYALTSIDTDLDGFPDLVVPDEGGVMVYSVKKESAVFYKPFLEHATAVYRIEDLNGDSVEDILLGGYPGSVVLSGKDGALIHNLPEPAYYGVILALEDINNDGVADIAVSSDRYGSGGSAGTIGIFSGKDGSRIRTIIGYDGGFAHTMATCPDQDGDAKSDLVVSRTALDTIYIFSASSGQVLRKIFNPFGDPGVYGSFMKRFGDLNGDGYDDIIISDFFNSVDSGSYAAGATFLYSGADFRLINSFYGVQFSYFGLSATVLGDLNGDGRQEIAIGAPGASKVYIFSTFTPGDANQDGRISLADVVVKINYIFRSGPRPFPMSVADDDCNGTIDLNDIICAVNYIFKGQTQGCCLK